MSTHDISRAERKTVVSQMVVFPKFNLLTMKALFHSVNNENLHCL